MTARLDTSDQLPFSCTRKVVAVGLAWYDRLNSILQIYNLFLSAGAAELGDPSRPLSWAKALRDGMLAIMK